MERNEQTGHICIWMALGIMAAIIIVGAPLAMKCVTNGAL